MNKKGSKIIIKSKKLNKKPRKTLNKSRKDKSTKDKSVKQNVNVNVTSAGGGGGVSSIPHPFLTESKGSRGEDVLLQKLTDLLSVNKINVPISQPFNTIPITNEIGTNTNTYDVSNIGTNTNPYDVSNIGTNTNHMTDEIGTNTFNEMIDATTQIDNKFNNLFEPSENIKIERKQNIDNNSLLDNFLTVQNTPARKNSINEGQGFTMYKPIYEPIIKKSSTINIGQYKIPTREEIRSLRNLNDLIKINPYNEGSIVPYKKVQHKVEPKVENSIVPYIKENSIVPYIKENSIVPYIKENSIVPYIKEQSNVEPKKKSKKYINIEKSDMPKYWIKNFNIKPKILKDDYNEIQNYMKSYYIASQSEKNKIRNSFKQDLLPKIQNIPITKVKQMVNNIEQKIKI